MPDINFKVHKNKIHGKLTIEPPVSCQSHIKGNCFLGFMSYIGAGGELYSNTNIDRFSSIAKNVTISPTNHPTDYMSSHLFAFGNDGPFKGNTYFEKWKLTNSFPENERSCSIGNDVWIGLNVVVKRGVNIGDGAIVGAGSVVIKDVPPYAIVGGVPARVIRYRFESDVINRLLELRWWNYDLSNSTDLGLDFTDTVETLNKLEVLVSNGSVQELEVNKVIVTKDS